MPDITPLYTVANQVLVNFFNQEGAKNYIAHVIEDKEKGEDYLITMQRVSGETPLHQLEAQKDRVLELEHALTQMLDLASRDTELFGGKRSDIVERIKEALNSK